MKRSQLYKSANDFAYNSLATSDVAQLDIDGATQFKKENLDPKDYTLWKQFMIQSRQQYLALSNQFVPSYVAPKPA